MKKIFTTLFVFGSIISISIAQSLSPYSVIPVIYGNPSDYSLVSNFIILNNKNITMNVKVQRYDLSIVSGADNSFCWAGTCFANTTYLSPNYAVIPANSADGSFYGDYYPNGISGISTIGYKFFDMNNVSDSVLVTINYDVSVTGINHPNTAANFASFAPNPASNMVALTYNFQEGKGDFKIYDVLGNLVRLIAPGNRSGTVIFNVSDLKQGIYIISMQLDSKSVKNMKLVVRH